MTTMQYDNTAALHAYCEAIARLQAQIILLQVYVDDHGNTLPENIHWGHVGTMNHIVTQIETVIESL